MSKKRKDALDELRKIVDQINDTCKICEGSGGTSENPCKACEGSGHVCVKSL